ncbi:methyltransferase domain-containing protein [bacterium]|nr:methyltransferase domain-containing protein [bacterium]
METQTAPNPQRIMQFAFGFVPSVAVYSAIQLNVFSAIAEGKDTIASLAAACGCQERGMAPLVHTLTSLGLLQQHGEQFKLCQDTEMFLLPSSQAYLGGVLAHQTREIASWVQLPEAIRQGHAPGTRVESDQDDGAFFAGFVDSLFNLNWPAAQSVARSLPVYKTAIDIGCGSAVWSLALAAAQPELQVVAVDRQVVLDQVAKVFATRLGCSERYQFRAGNFRDVELGKSDVAFLGHILHSEGEAASRVLLKRIYEGLNPGGVLVVAEMVASDPRGQDVFSNLFDLNMLMWTQDGTVFTRAQLEEMGREAGFTRFEWLTVPNPQPVLLCFR